MPMYDTNSFIKAGIPLSKDLLKYGNAIDQFGKTVTPDVLEKNLDYWSLYGIVQQQNRIETLERYMWINIPFGLTQDLIERVLFYRGKGILYYNENIEKFQFLPFALNGQIDEYGRYLRCNTLPFTGVSEEENQKFLYENLDIVYDLPYSKEQIELIRNKKTVGIILNDSSLGVSQEPIIRSRFVQPILHLLATLIQIINTAMFGCADANLVKIENESEKDSIKNQLDAINQAILKGKRFIPIIDKLPIDIIKTSSSSDVEGLFNIFNSLTNFLKSITGVANPGVFDKKAHLLQEEQQLNGSNADDIYYNGLRQRQEFCLLVQAYYGYPIWCESKRGMSEAQAENMQQGETSDPDNTQYNPQEEKGDE